MNFEPEGLVGALRRWSRLKGTCVWRIVWPLIWWWSSRVDNKYYKTFDIFGTLSHPHISGFEQLLSTSNPSSQIILNISTQPPTSPRCPAHRTDFNCVLDTWCTDKVVAGGLMYFCGHSKIIGQLISHSPFNIVAIFKEYLALQKYMLDPITGRTIS